MSAHPQQPAAAAAAPVYVGIDVSKATLDVCVDGGPDGPRQAFAVANDPAGIAAVVASVKQVLAVLERQRDKLDRQIADLVEADDDWRGRAALVQTVPGVGPGTAVQLVADLPELGRLDRRQVAAPAGVAPLNDDSGTRRGKRPVRGGRVDLRCGLYMAAFNAIRRAPALAAFVARLRAAGKPFKVVVVAVMRKLLTVLNAMVKTGTPWTDKLAEVT